MLTLEEAIKKVDKLKQRDEVVYTKWDNLYLFSDGELTWITVDDKTGKVSDICPASLMFEHLEDSQFDSNGLKEAIKNTKIFKLKGA